MSSGVRSVALFTYSTLPRGSVVHTAHLAEALHDAGWPVTVYALDKDGRGFFRPLRAPVRLVPAGPAPSSTAALVRQRRQELADFLRAQAPDHDVYHAQDCLTASALLDLRAQGLVPAVVRTVHHLEQFSDPYLAQCQERSIREAALCLTVSKATARDLACTFGVHAPCVGNGVAVARFARTDAARIRAWRRRLGGGGPLVLAVGGVEERKNSLRILGAFARVRARHPDARLWILGGATVLDHGAYRESFTQALANLPRGAREAVVELGVIDDAEVPALFQAAHVLALPSLHEGFGLAALEALAAGLPVVASHRPPFTEFLDESCATLVDPLSHEAIAEGMLSALATAGTRRTPGQLRARDHSWRRVAAAHVEHYLSVTNRLMKERVPHARDALHGSLA
jgi:glycosyltransferase-like protein